MNGRPVMLLATALMLALPQGAALADIYQYVDENGVIHFTNVGGGKNRRKVKAEPKQASASAPKPVEPAPSRQPKAGEIPASFLDIISAACNKHGVDPSLVHAIIKVESDFNPYALSRKGAMGLMQLMPRTAVEMNVKNSFNPLENVEGGVKYLRYLLDLYEGNLSLALAAYNAGETSVKRWGTVPPFRETQNYVKKILRLYRGNGRTFTTQYTIYISYSEDGSLVLTDNPANHKNRTFSRKTVRGL